MIVFRFWNVRWCKLCLGPYNVSDNCHFAPASPRGTVRTCLSLLDRFRASQRFHRANTVQEDIFLTRQTPLR
jgi:hypothetical protein